MPQASLRRIGFPWSAGLVQRTLASVGGTIAAARHALAVGWCGGLAGGTHHAFRDEGSGFCVFNDIAVAIEVVRRENLAQRVSIVDLDVHQGDGTAAIFEEDKDVLTISVHGQNNFPVRKRRSKLDVPLADGTGDAEFLIEVQRVLMRALQFQPDLLFFQSGVDGLEQDTLGRLALTHAGLKERDRMVLNACRESKVPCVITLGGGYAEPIDLTVQAHVNTFLTAAEIYRSK
ncbi:MAG: histone deacetylase [Bryobacteraceae bacterium]